MDSKGKKKNKKTSGFNLLHVLVIICIALAVAIVVMAMQLIARSSETSVVSISSVSTASSDISSVSTSSEILETSEESTSAEEEVVLPEVSPISSDTINSLYGYMIRVADNAVVLEKNSTDSIYPASMTKIMTILVCIEYLNDLDEELQITTEVLAQLYEQHSSLAGCSEGEWVSVRDLMYCALLASGGEACVTLANRVAGSEEAFAELMNQKAAEIGLTNTHFTNSTGLDDENQYTSCVDMAMLLEYAIQNETFYNIITAHDYTCEPTEYHPDGLYLNSTLFSQLSTDVMSNGTVIMGGKTGTTNQAGYCLASFADYNGQLYILVTALGRFDGSGIQYHIEDAINAYSALQ